MAQALRFGLVLFLVRHAMFLVVFVTLVISIIALYAQIIGLQTAQIYNSQVALMQTMATWHSAAVSYVMANPPTNISTGCQLNSAAITSPPVCLHGGNMILSASTAPPYLGYLPTGFAYNFNSIAFQSGAPATNYVLTYAGIDGNGFVAPLTGGSTGYSAADLIHQFVMAGPATLSYGIIPVGVNGGITWNATLKSLSKLVKGINVTTGNAQYTIPAGVIPANAAGSVAVISVAQ